MDAHNRYQGLAASISSASSSSAASSAVAAVSSLLRRHPADQLRPFFTRDFPSLLLRLFGFDSPSSSWLDLAASDPSLASALSALLSPSGPLLSAAAAADRLSLVKYAFPVERLPEWMRAVLQVLSADPAALAGLCPLFAGKLKEDSVQGAFQIQLSIFEYYIFWFAYYPVSQGKSQGLDSGTARRGRVSRMQNWVLMLPVLSKTGKKPGQNTESRLYLQLLYSYLQAFVPKLGAGSYQPHCSSLLHYSTTDDGTAFLQAEFTVHALLQFWMIYNDFSPLPTQVCRSLGVTVPLRAALGETPPTPGLGDELKLFVKYLNWRPVSSRDRNCVMYGRSLQWKSGSMALCWEGSAGSWSAVMQRPLYRFILRTFLFCPMGTSIKNATQVFSLWMAYLEPWKSNEEGFAEFDAPQGDQHSGNGGDGQRRSQREPLYTLAWQSYVLSNYLFYNSLAVHFLGFAHRFLHTNVELVMQMVSKMLSILTSPEELLDLLRKVDVAYHSNSAGQSAHSIDNVYKYAPSICEQLQDWHDGLSDSDAYGSLLHGHLKSDLRLFSDGENGAHNLLQLLLLRAEHEIRLLPREASQNLQTLDLIKSQIKKLFSGQTQKFRAINSSEERFDQLHVRGEAFTPKHPGIGRSKWLDVKYKGDWMRRPISDTEVAWLARRLIQLSDWSNELLGLDHADADDAKGPTYIEVSHDEVRTVAGPKEALCVVAALIRSWILLLPPTIVKFMRAHRMKVNLRLLASKKIVMLLILCVFGIALKILS